MINAALAIGFSNALVATLLAILACAVSRRLRPQWALAVWLLVLVKLLAPPLWNPPLASLYALIPATQTVPADDVLTQPNVAQTRADRLRPLTADQSALLGVEDLSLHPPELLLPPPLASQPATAHALMPWIAPGLFVLWAAGTTAWIVLALCRIRRFRVLLRRARRAPAPLEHEVSTLADRLGLKKVPSVRIARRRISPFVWVLFGPPTILLPAGLLRRLNRPQRTALLLHELAHLRRRDHWTKFIELAAVCTYWWLPTAWWARREAERAAEHCCDALVVSHAPSASRDYAVALLATIDFLSDTSAPLPLGASGFSQFGYVSRRIEMILHPHARRRHSWPVCLAMLALVVATLPMSVQPLWAEPAAATLQDAVEPIEPQPAIEPIEPQPPADSQPAKPQVPAVPGVPATVAKETIAKEPLPKVKTSQQPAGKPAAVAKQPTLTENNIERELGQIVADTTTSVNLVQTNLNRRQAAARQLAAVQTAFDTSTVALDQLLECQRRLADAKLTYALNVCALCPSPNRRKLLEAEATLAITSETMQQARRTWRQVHDGAQRDGQSGQREPEEQAREQYFHFKKQAERALADYLALTGSPKKAAKFRSSAQSPTKPPAPLSSVDDKSVPIKVMGPLTAGTPEPLDPPTDAEVLRAFIKSNPAASESPGAQRRMIRIVKEKIAEYVDPPKHYPLIGPGQLHHAHYECTIYSRKPDGGEQSDVIFIDHNHIHQVPIKVSESAPKTSASAPQVAGSASKVSGSALNPLDPSHGSAEFNLGLESTIPLGQRKLLSTVRHLQLQLAREQAILAALRASHAKLSTAPANGDVEATQLADRAKLDDDIRQAERRLAQRTLELEAAKNELLHRLSSGGHLPGAPSVNAAPRAPAAPSTSTVPPASAAPPTNSAPPADDSSNATNKQFEFFVGPAR